MNFALDLLIAEWVIVSLAFLVYLAVKNWRRRNQLVAELDAMFDRVGGLEQNRRVRLEERLIEFLQIDEEEAESLSIEIIRSEQSLFKTFADIQLHDKPAQLATFDRSVYSLLDHYWELLALRSGTEWMKPGDANEADPISDSNPMYHVGTEDEDSPDYMQSETGEPQDLPAESGRRENSNETENIADHAEPTWDDAFAEAAQGHDPKESERESLT
jgi:hypothetical protein